MSDVSDVSPFGAAPNPLRLEIEPRAFAQAEQIAEWLEIYGQDTVTRFADALNRETRTRCQEFAERLATGQTLGPEDEAGSLGFSRPVFKRRFTTRKTRARGSSGGTYFVYYGLGDSNRDGKADALILLAVQHSATRPTWEMDRETEDE